MIFAAICVVALAAVLFAIARPLLSGARVSPARGQYDRAVYLDQLREVERDLGRGVLSPEEANAARLEIQRRLLAVNVAERADAPGRSPLLAAAAVLFVIAGAGGLYWRLGAPRLPDVPFDSRPVEQAGGADQSEVKEAAARLKQKLAAEPRDAGAWVLYARTLSVLSDWDHAADAYRHAIDLGQNSGDVLAGYGEMQVMAADGIVPPAAREAFAAALAKDRSSGVARYYLALADGQAGEEHKAIAAWLELAAGLPEGAPMRDEIARRIAEAAAKGGFDAPPMPSGQPPDTGPTRQQVEAAAMMPAAEREKLIDGMIEKLAAKLNAQPNDQEGWQRLGEAYVARRQADKAVAAFDRAAALKPGDPGIMMQTVAALLSGLKAEEPWPPRAVALLSQVAAIAPDAPEVLWYLGLEAAHEGRVADARAKWTKLLEALPADDADAKMVRTVLDALPRR